ncbi:MAG: hypothetical protein M1832_005442 [Thelocarpon impressellum]|nr:MAG: hypothetical protein M1832_005442 [Thelocarpon impressellum]
MATGYFPQFHDEAPAPTSPFLLKHAETEQLRSSRALKVIRAYLANDRDQSPSNGEDEEAWLLHRDVTFALICPLLEIFRQASQMARKVLAPRHEADLELAYRGDARGAFSWMQCFFREEKDWCATRGCPACVVSYIFQSEPTVRLILVACRLSHYLQLSDDQPSLPMFTFWLRSLRTALDNDPFWGPAYWEEIEPRARWLEKGIEDLVYQCCDMETTSADGRRRRSDSSDSSESYPDVSSAGQMTRPGPAIQGRDRNEKQQRLIKEEGDWRRGIAVACWKSLLGGLAREDVADVMLSKANGRLTPARGRPSPL